MDEFTRFITQKGEELYRDMPWREDVRPYYVLVSEIMLQQTQVARVKHKFNEFIAAFPNEKALAEARLTDVLMLWQGLGYNRRAKYLHEAAKMVVCDFDGIFPYTKENILRLPGVGKNTAGAILAYAYNQPAIFVETNIRTVYIHHFLSDNFAVDDKQIIELLNCTIDYKNPRRFYQSLMDYGAWLKAQGVRNISQSHHYKRQSPLKGSVREVRGQIIRLLGYNRLTERELMSLTNADSRFSQALGGLKNDGLICETDGLLHLAD